MAIRAELEVREPQCHSSGDWIDLARDALAAPQDVGYATELLQRAELKCQSVHDYLDLAAFVSHECQDPAYAQDLYSHAESVANTPEERIEVCESLMHRTGDLQQAREILETALRRAQSNEQIIAVAHCADATLGIPALVRKALGTLTSPIRDMDEFTSLTESILALGHEGLARAVFQAGSRLCVEMSDLIAYAELHWRLFNDQQGALDILGDAEADCQSTHEFVSLAGAYRRLFQDNDRVAELMELAVEYAINAEDQLDLAEGYWRHLHNTTAAAEVYRTVLPSLESTSTLNRLAEHIGTHLGDLVLCRDYLNRAAELTDELDVIIQCAQIARRLISDKAAATDLLESAAKRFGSDADRQHLIHAAIDIKLPELAPRYIESRLFDADLAAALDCAEIIHEKLDSRQLLRQAMETARKAARTPNEFIELSNLAADFMDDRGFNRDLLESAEQLAADPEEFQAISQEVKARFPYDNPWHERLRVSAMQREANEAVYEKFRQRESQAQTVHALTRLATQAAADLDDRNLVRRLLIKAESRLDAGHPVLTDILEIMDTVALKLDDTDWIERLADRADRECSTFPDLLEVVERNHRYLPEDIAQHRCHTQLERWQRTLNERNNTRCFDYLKLARAIFNHTDNQNWAVKVLDKATAISEGSLEKAMVSETFQQFGDGKSAEHFRKVAVESCTDLPTLRSLVRFLGSAGYAEEDLKNVYAEAGRQFVRPRERLYWAEGILAMFSDKAWAHREYASLKSTCGRGLDEATYRASLNHKLLGKL